MFNFIYEAIGWLLGTIFELTSNYGLSIILLTIIIKVLLIPLTNAQTKSQKSMNEIQPKIKEINAKYKNDREKLNEETLKLYRENNINPAAGCLPLLIQLPIIWSLFRVIREPLVYVFDNNVQLAQQATQQQFLWISDFALPDTLSTVLNFDFASSLPGILPIVASLLTYLQFKTMNNRPQSGGDTANSMMKNMQIFMPLMFLWFGLSMPAGVMLYWAISTGFQILQQLYIQRYATTKEA